MSDSIPVILYRKHSELVNIVTDIVNNEEWACCTYETLQEARYIIATENVRVCIVELHGEEDGYRFLQEIGEHFNQIYPVVVAIEPSIEDAVNAMKFGAVDYLSGPSIAECLPELLRALKVKVRTRDKRVTESLVEFSGSVDMVGNSKPFKRTVHKARIAAQENDNILLTGESGTGKELFARAIHRNSARADNGFIPVNCGAIPGELLESELFGHVKGAYTGAETTQAGFFQSAQGGTLFLDEIANTSPAMQAKLLRVIEEKEVWKIGARRPDTIDVRIVAATNKQLPEMVQKDQFRSDLYYRLKVLSLYLPPLRDRTADILPLIEHFAREWERNHEVVLPTFSEPVLDRLQKYPWPGNIRELRNVIIEMLTFAETDVITLDNLPTPLRETTRGWKESLYTLEFMEKMHIHKICNSTRWNISRAAKILGIGRQTLYRKLQQYHLGSY